MKIIVGVLLNRESKLVIIKIIFEYFNLKCILICIGFCKLYCDKYYGGCGKNIKNSFYF